MPGEAVALGAAQYVLPLEQIAAKLRTLAETMDLTRAQPAANAAGPS